VLSLLNRLHKVENFLAGPAFACHDCPGCHNCQGFTPIEGVALNGVRFVDTINEKLALDVRYRGI
jgi:hypothetical protein